MSNSNARIFIFHYKDLNLNFQVEIIFQELESFRVSRKLDILYAMTIFMDEKENVHRELVILSPSVELLENSMKFLLTTDLKLEQVEQAASSAFLKEGYHVAFMVQHNTGEFQVENSTSVQF